MSRATVRPEDLTPDAIDVPRAARGRPLRVLVRAGGTLAALVAVWLIVLLLHAVHADWVTLIGVLLGTAALSRAGGSIIDRIMVAIAVFLGLGAAGGLLFSVWPFGLGPVAVGGVALTVLVVISGASGRMPRLPRPRPADLGVLGGMAGAWWFMASLYRTWGLGEQVSLMQVNDDFSRHFMIFDTIRNVGGYMWQRWASASACSPPAYRAYPQGSHMVTALLADFVRSGTDPGTGGASFHLFTIFYAGSWVLLCGVILWSVRWVAGPRLGTAGTLLASAAVTVFMLYGSMITLYVSGSSSEIAGLIAVVLLAAVVARPIAGIREHLLVLGALLLAVSFVYYLFLPAAAALAVVSLWQCRRRVWSVRWYALVAAAVVGALGAVPPMVNAASNSVAALNAGGGIYGNPTWLLLGIPLLTGAGALALAARSPVWRAATAALVVLSGSVAALYLYQVQATGGTHYYYVKAVHALLVVACGYVGGLAVLVRRGLRAVAPGRGAWSRAVRLTAPVLLALALTDAMVSGLPFDTTTWGAKVLGHQVAAPWRGDAAQLCYDRHPVADGVWTICWISGGWNPVLATGYVSVWRREYATGGGVWAVLDPRTGGPNPAKLGPYLRTVNRPVRIVTTEPKVIAEVKRLKAADPSLRVELDAVR